MYLQWGLMTIEGLTIDGEAATPAQLLAKGPDDLSARNSRRDQTTVRAKRGGKKKLDRRVPFSIWKQGRVELRSLQKERPGEKASLRVAAA